MKQGTLGFALLLVTLFSPWVGAVDSPTGRWIAVDDKTGQKRAIVRINVANGTLNGSIVDVFPGPGNLTACTKCPGSLRNRPIKGLPLIWGLKNKGDGVWGEGYILDPRSGTVYRAKITYQDNKLYVRGYLGISMIGRTQIWIRV